MSGERPDAAHEPAAELLTVGDWLRWTATRLGRAELHFGHGTASAWDDAVALVLGWLRIPDDRGDALLGARLTEPERAALAECVRRRVEERVPTAYLTGRAFLAGLEFEVDPRVLVPRSPIGGLLEAGLQPWLGDRHPTRILDLCTGCGCLGIVAAMLFPEAEVDLADISEDALAVAEANVRRHGLEGRVHCVRSDAFEGLGERRYDLILCNPPYVDAADLASMPPEYRHEPRLGLEGGEDGLELVERLVRAFPAHLAEDGLVVLELGNSAPALHRRFPELPVLWPELEHGGTGVALLEASELRSGV
ncbi:MAG: 50S ribosomal protein L3 N(5)-glutamine methyltransferase [Pseudomonadales bacterium]|jgi:ribosomal protein L3 glutamine methyltransferase|nr:50S ribosomal protein L3 N(5)-glutamine methyltransferase [Pseudomonadales bacterium]